MMKNKFFPAKDGCPFKVHPVSNGINSAFAIKSEFLK
jgi:hypothetical protein